MSFDGDRSRASPAARPRTPGRRAASLSPSAAAVSAFDFQASDIYRRLSLLEIFIDIYLFWRYL